MIKQLRINRRNNNKIKAILEKGVNEGVYPGAVLFVAQKGRMDFFREAGHLSLIPEPVLIRKDTIFDLASLTKPLATTLAMMKLVDEGNIDLDLPLSEVIPVSFLKEKRKLTPRLLLNHSAGLVDWKPFYLDLLNYRQEERKRKVRDWIIDEPFVYPPGKGCLYSDLGFMLLEWVIEAASGMAMDQYIRDNFYRPLSLKSTFLYTGPYLTSFKKERFAATEDCPWRGKIIQGQVHDENAFALGGYSGHAGMFGVVEEIYSIVNMLMAHYRGVRNNFFKPQTVREFFQRQDIVDNCTWALGWDTPSTEGSSSGKYFSPDSVGHLGFSGTSLWMDLKKDIIVIFLTNRVHPTRNNMKIREFRPKIHDLIMGELGGDG